MQRLLRACSQALVSGPSTSTTARLRGWKSVSFAVISGGIAFHGLSGRWPELKGVHSRVAGSCESRKPDRGGQLSSADYDFLKKHVGATMEEIRTAEEALSAQIVGISRASVFLLMRRVLKPTFFKGTADECANIGAFMTEEQYEPARQRLHGLLAGTDHDDDQQANTLQAFLQEHPEWLDGYVYYRDAFPGNGLAAFSERVQLSGLCYQHAPVQAARARLARTQGGSGQAVDMTALMLQRPAQFLQQRILHNEGGSSVDFLEEITNTELVPVERSGESIRSALMTYGPLLVSTFKVYPELRSHEGVLHPACCHGRKEGLHAMVIIGYRKCSIHGDIILLQNWWKRKPFLEMTVSYLILRAGTIHAIPNSFTEYPERFVLNSCAHLEVELLDCAERLEEKALSSQL